MQRGGPATEPPSSVKPDQPFPSALRFQASVPPEVRIQHCAPLPTALQSGKDVVEPPRLTQGCQPGGGVSGWSAAYTSIRGSGSPLRAPEIVLPELLSACSIWSTVAVGTAERRAAK